MLIVKWMGRLRESSSKRDELSALIRRIDSSNAGLWYVIFSRTQDYKDSDFQELILSLERLFLEWNHHDLFVHPILWPAMADPTDRSIILSVRSKLLDRQRAVMSYEMAHLKSEVKRKAFSVGSMMGISAIVGAAGISLGQYIYEEPVKTDNVPAQEEWLTDEQIEILREQRQKFIQQNHQLEWSVAE